MKLARSSKSLAKLHRPRLHAPIARKRLFRALDSARREQPFIWVAGPPGAGKTTLIGSYLEVRHPPYLWYQIDSGDSDPATFFFYLAELAKSGSGKKPLPYFTAEYLPDLAGFARNYFRDLFSRLAKGSVLVLDNCHNAATQVFQGILKEAIGEIPDGITVIAISRSRAPSEFVRQYANEMLYELGWEELRLTQDEANAIARRRGLKVSAGSNELHHASDGWVAGLILMLAQGKQKILAQGAPNAHSKDAIFAYFAGEIFDAASLEEQDILTKTALLPEFTPQMAMKLSGNKQATKLLETLYRLQYFLERRDDADVYYHYHDLFREFLLKRLAASQDRRRLKSLQRRAAGLLATSGDLAAAIALYVAAESWVELAATVEANAERLLSQGRWQTVRNWIECFPEQRVEANPWLIYWLGASLAPIDPAQAVVQLKRAYRDFRSRKNLKGELLAVSAIIEAIYYQQTAFATFDPWIEILDKLLARPRRVRELELEMRTHTAMLYATLLRRPDHPMLRICIEHLKRLLTSDAGITYKVNAALALLRYCNQATDLELGQYLVDSVSPLVEKEALSPSVKALWLCYVGYHKNVRGEQASSLQHLDAAWELADEYGLLHVSSLARAFLVIVHSTIGSLDEAEKILAATGERHDPARTMQRFYYYVGASSIAAVKGDYAAAHSYAEISVRDADALGAPVYRIIRRAQLALYLVHLDQLPRALTVVAEAKRLIGRSCLGCFNVLLEAVQALVAIKENRPRDANRHLTAAIYLASNTGAGWLFGWLGPSLGMLFSEALRMQIEVAFLHELIRRFRVPPPCPIVEPWPWPVKLYTLGDFRILLDGKALAAGRKTHFRVLELLKLLVAYGGDVSIDTLADGLWPDSDAPAALSTLKSTVHRLRKLLGHEEAVIQQDGKLDLNTQLCWVDVLAFETLSNKLDRLADDSDELIVTVQAQFEEAVNLYRGAFLPQEPHAWILPTRKRLQDRFIRLVLALGGAFERNGRNNAAERLYRRSLGLEPSAQAIALKLQELEIARRTSLPTAITSVTRIA